MGLRCLLLRKGLSVPLFVLGTVWTITGDKGNVQLGEAVAAAGDVNGDGYGDVIVGSPNYVNGEHSEGGAYVYHGSAGGLS